jgi:hypothetical protein
MAERPIVQSESVDIDEVLAQNPHPRGTLVIIILFGLFFGLTWLGTYVFVFLQRGAPQP